MIASLDTPPTPSICVGCGLCCDGTVLSHLAVADESDLGWPLRMLGVELIVESEPPAFALPCPAVCEGVCTVYERHRPSACAQFSCDLLNAVEDGRVDVEDARGIIRDTIQMRDRVRSGTTAEAELVALVRARFRGAQDRGDDGIAAIRAEDPQTYRSPS